MNIISCHRFDKYIILAVNLMCGSDLVPYSHSKGSFVVETEVGGVDNIPVTVKKKAR